MRTPLKVASVLVCSATIGWLVWHQTSSRRGASPDSVKRVSGASPTDFYLGGTLVRDHGAFSFRPFLETLPPIGGVLGTGQTPVFRFEVLSSSGMAAVVPQAWRRRDQSTTAHRIDASPTADGVYDIEPVLVHAPPDADQIAFLVGGEQLWSIHRPTVGPKIGAPETIDHKTDKFGSVIDVVWPISGAPGQLWYAVEVQNEDGNPDWRRIIVGNHVVDGKVKAELPSECTAVRIQVTDGFRLVGPVVSTLQAPVQRR